MKFFLKRIIYTLFFSAISLVGNVNEIQAQQVPNNTPIQNLSIHQGNQHIAGKVEGVLNNAKFVFIFKNTQLGYESSPQEAFEGEITWNGWWFSKKVLPGYSSLKITKDTIEGQYNDQTRVYDSLIIKSYIQENTFLTEQNFQLSEIIHGSVTTVPATNITSSSATIGLELSSGDFLNHGFVYKKLSEAGGIDYIHIGDCIPNMGPGTDPYEDNIYRETIIQGLELGETYLYYACAKYANEEIIKGNIESFSIGNETISGCLINKVRLAPHHGSGKGFVFNATNAILTINVSGCNDGVLFRLTGINENNHELRRIDGNPGIVHPNSSGLISVKFKVNEDPCDSDNAGNGADKWGYDCVTYISIFDGSNTLLYSGKNSALLTKPNLRSIAYGNYSQQELEQKYNSLFDNGILVGSCSNGLWCSVGSLSSDHNNNWKYDGLLLGSTNSIPCTIPQDGVRWMNLTLDSDGNGPFIKDNSPRLHINTSNCKGSNINITLKRKHSWVIPKIGDIKVKVEEIDTLVSTLSITPQSDELVLSFISNEGDCWTPPPWQNPPHCRVFVHINTSSGVVSTESAIDLYVQNWQSPNSPHLDKGALFAYCSEGIELLPIGGSWTRLDCFGKNWILKNITGGHLTDFSEGNPENVYTIPPYYDEDSPCFISYEEGYDPNCYELLASIPGIGDVQKNGRWAISNLENYQLGTYVQSVFGVALGILMVLAVIMIIVAGVQYMTVESFYGKSDAKQRITNALVGLVLALGIFIILNTINPRLLEINFGKDIQKVGLDIVLEQDTPTPTVTLSNLEKQQIQDYINAAGIHCPMSGGQSEIPQIVASFVNKTTYRLGGKYINLGNPMPAYSGQDIGKGCPVDTGTLCLDCSGFANMVAQCAGLVDLHVGSNFGTSGMFNQGAGGKIVQEIDIENRKVKINNEFVDLEIGDFLGYTGSSIGHVWVYIGEGKVAESTGASRETNQMIRITEMSNLKNFESRVNRIHQISNLL